MMDEKSFSFIELFKENQAKYIRFAYSVDSNVDFPQIVIEKGATKRGTQR